MIRSHKYLFIIFFACMLGLFVATPKNVFADTKYLANCDYYDEGRNNRVFITIYPDDTMTATINKFEGGNYDTFINTTKSYNFENKDNIIKTAKKREGKKKCPNYVSIRVEKTTGTGLASITHYTINVRGYYKKSTMNKACKEYMKDNASGTNDPYDCINLSYKQCTGGTACEENNGNKKDINSCQEILGDPNDTGSVAYLLQKLFDYIKILGPLLVIILSSMDFAKVVMTGDEKSMKKAQSNLGIRIACAVLLFFLPSIVELIINLVLNGQLDATKLCGIK